MSSRGGVPKLFSLENKSAVVTGATGYFGRSFCEALLGAGATVCLLGRSEKKLQTLGRALSDRFGSEHVRTYIADSHDDDAFRAALADADESVGGVDILVNNAFEFSRETGFNHPSGELESIDRDQWMRALTSGVYWHASAIQVLIGGMKTRGEGSIINVSSMYGKVAPDPALYRGRKALNPAPYAAAKAAILGLTRYVASFYGEYGVRCNALLPGAFPNASPEAFNSTQDEELLQDLVNRTVLGRVGRVEDLSGALIFLASDASSYVTGQEIVVDGGWTVR
jgi:gluconate 5-dehydrogenase